MFFLLAYRLERHRVNNNPWIDQIKDQLCSIIHQRKQLITIFKFDSERHHGNLEDAILEALFNGLYSSFFNRETRFFDSSISRKILRRYT